MMFRALITFLLFLVVASPAGSSGSTPAIRLLRRGGAAGVRLRVLGPLAHGVGRILMVFLEICAMKLALRPDSNGVLIGDVGVAALLASTGALVLVGDRRRRLE